MGNTESEVDFKETAEILVTQDLSNWDQSFWDTFLSYEQSEMDMFSVLTSSFLGKVNPDNLYMCLQQLLALLENASQTDLLILRNAIRIGSRIITFLLESSDSREKLWYLDLAPSLIKGAMKGLFAEGFTIQSLNDIPWSRKMYGESGKYLPYEMKENRILLMRLLICCFTETLYINYEDITELSNPWIKLTCSYDTEFGQDLFFSLLEVVLTHDRDEQIPYSGFFFEGNEVYQSTAANLLLLLIDDGVFNDCIQDLEKSHFDFVLENFTRLMGVVVNNQKSHILGILKKFSYEIELTLLFRSFLLKNEEFRHFVSDSESLDVIQDFLMIKANECAKHPNLQGNFYLYAMVVQQLSSLREFSLLLSRKIEFYSQGEEEYVIDNVIQLSVSNFHFLRVLVNVSAVVKEIGKTASRKITNMFEISLLKENENLDKLIEVIHNRLQYQWNGSVHLIYLLLSLDSRYKELAIRKSHVLEKFYGYLVPKTEHFISNLGYVKDEDVLDYLRGVTLVGVLPKPHQLQIYVIDKDNLIKDWVKSFTAWVVFIILQNYELVDYEKVKIVTAN